MGCCYTSRLGPNLTPALCVMSSPMAIHYDNDCAAFFSPYPLVSILTYLQHRLHYQTQRHRASGGVPSVVEVETNEDLCYWN